MPAAFAVNPAVLAASLSDWPGNSTKQFQAVKDRLAGFIADGQLGLFTNALDLEGKALTRVRTR